MDMSTVAAPGAQEPLPGAYGRMFSVSHTGRDFSFPETVRSLIMPSVPAMDATKAAMEAGDAKQGTSGGT
jgi:hypothetical protein